MTEVAGGGKINTTFSAMCGSGLEAPPESMVKNVKTNGEDREMGKRMRNQIVAERMSLSSFSMTGNVCKRP